MSCFSSLRKTLGLTYDRRTVQPLVQVPGNLEVAIANAFSKVFRTRAEAEAHYDNALQNGEVERLSLEFSYDIVLSCFGVASAPSNVISAPPSLYSV